MRQIMKVSFYARATKGFFAKSIVLAASGFGAAGAMAQMFPPQMAAPTTVAACQTATGIHPMFGVPVMPGAPCGNGFEQGVTIVIGNSGLPPIGAPGFPPPSVNRGFPPVGAPGFAQGGIPGRLAGALGANPEIQIASECAAAGSPMAVAACTSSRLTTRELQKCGNGIGTPDGCFGPNNTLRRHLENAVGDVVNGPGPSNDLVGREGFTCKSLGICF
jgi:hypothetical protein